MSKIKKFIKLALNQCKLLNYLNDAQLDVTRNESGKAIRGPYSRQDLDDKYNTWYAGKTATEGDMSKVDDEYGILDILKRHNAESALPEVAAKFDSICNQYMSVHDDIRKDAFTEVNCYLKKAVIDCRGDDSALRQRIKSIIEGLGEEIETKEL